MARVQNPILFSAYFGVQRTTIAAAGLIDPFLDVDVPLFIDPILLAKSSNAVIAMSAVERAEAFLVASITMISEATPRAKAVTPSSRIGTLHMRYPTAAPRPGSIASAHGIVAAVQLLTKVASASAPSSTMLEHVKGRPDGQGWFQRRSHQNLPLRTQLKAREARAPSAKFTLSDNPGFRRCDGVDQ
jgi:hypothetical protein